MSLCFFCGVLLFFFFFFKQKTAYGFFGVAWGSDGGSSVWLGFLGFWVFRVGGGGGKVTPCPT